MNNLRKRSRDTFESATREVSLDCSNYTDQVLYYFLRKLDATDLKWEDDNMCTISIPESKVPVYLQVVSLEQVVIIQLHIQLVAEMINETLDDWYKSQLCLNHIGRHVTRIPMEVSLKSYFDQMDAIYTNSIKGNVDRVHDKELATGKMVFEYINEEVLSQKRSQDSQASQVQPLHQVQQVSQVQPLHQVQQVSQVQPLHQVQ